MSDTSLQQKQPFNNDNRFVLELQCPYCGFMNKIYDARMLNKELTVCAPEDGGCENYFVYEIKTVTVTADVFKIALANKNSNAPDTEEQELAPL